MRRNVGWGFLVFVMVTALVEVAGGKELPVSIGDTKSSVIARLGEPVNIHKVSQSELMLLYSTYIVCFRKGRVCFVRSTRNCKETISSLGLGSSIGEVRRIMGEPDFTTKRSFYYFKPYGQIVAFGFDEKNKVKNFLLDESKRYDKIVKRKKDGIVNHNRNQKIAKSDREYKKARRKRKREFRKTHELTGSLLLKHAKLTPSEKSHNVDRHYHKFSMEYTALENGKKRRIRQDCFIDKYDLYIKRKLDSLSPGDSITIIGNFKHIEVKGIGAKGIKLGDTGLDADRSIKSIFCVNSIR